MGWLTLLEKARVIKDFLSLFLFKKTVTQKLIILKFFEIFFV